MSAREFCATNKAKICIQFVSTFYRFTNKNKNEELNVGDQKTGNTEFDRISGSLLSLSTTNYFQEEVNPIVLHKEQMWNLKFYISVQCH